MISGIFKRVAPVNITEILSLQPYKHLIELVSIEIKAFKAMEVKHRVSLRRSSRRS